MTRSSRCCRTCSVVVSLLSMLAGILHPASAQVTGKTGALADSDLLALKSPDPKLRIETLRSIQTSLDPRLPDALLPLLSDEGQSIRRLAARAVGSRWWQIPKERQPAFIRALEQLRKENVNERVTHMAERALGLLRRDYRSPMFSRSSNKRWVIYERRGLPCLIDARKHSEELLGWTPEHDKLEFRPHLANGIFNLPLGKAVLWHPKKEMAAFAMVTSGRPHPMEVWVWQHHSGVVKRNYAEIAGELGYPGEARFFSAELRAWDGDELQVFLEGWRQSMVFGWNVSTNRLRLIP